MYGIRGLLKPLSVRQVKHSRIPWMNQYELINDLVYLTKAGDKIVVPAGFVTNFATWIKPKGRYKEAATIHDYLYGNKAGRYYADSIFKEVMTRACCSRKRINMMYYGVRCFAWWAYYVSPLLGD